MRDSSVLSLLLFAAILAIVVLVFKYAQLQSHVNDRVQQHVNIWKSRELDSLRSQCAQAARAEAGVALDRWRAESEAEIRADAVRRSSAVVAGKVTEHLTPYMGIFPFNPKDVRFLGTPVDLIVFDGLSEDALEQIVFLEIKTGSSSLTTRERRVRDIVLARRIAWKEFRVGG